MSSFGKFTLRFSAYGVVLLYLVGDLFVFYGPLHQRIQANQMDSHESMIDAERRGIVAMVFGNEITLGQVDHVVRTRLDRDSRHAIESLPPDRLRMHRYAALNELINHELLRVKVTHSASEYPIEDVEIDVAHARIRNRFANDLEYQNALIRSGHDEAQLRARIAARLQQSKYTRSKVHVSASLNDPILLMKTALKFSESLRIFETNRNRIHIRHQILQFPIHIDH